jgi:hypothetical protein
MACLLSSCWFVVDARANDRPRAGAAAAGPLDGDEDAQGDDVRDMPD